MSIPGTWQFFFSWGCTGGYIGEGITFNGDGSWSSTEGFTGRWTEVNGDFVLNIDGSATVYLGNDQGNAAVGIQTDFAGQTGCWYMTKDGIPTSVAQTAAARKSTGATLAGRGKSS